MNYQKHSELKGQHAFLGGSKYHWLYYDEEKLIDTYQNQLAVKRGIILHDFAARCIRIGQTLPRTQKTLNMYVNDAINFKMIPEQILFYSVNCFGTADAISFRNNKLRIHDLKTGSTPAHMEQLLIYAALYCLENNANPNAIEVELRIYQNNDIIAYIPEAEEIRTVINKIIASDKIIEKIKDLEEPWYE